MGGGLVANAFIAELSCQPQTDYFWWHLYIRPLQLLENCTKGIYFGVLEGEPRDPSHIRVIYLFPHLCVSLPWEGSMSSLTCYLICFGRWRESARDSSNYTLRWWWERLLIIAHTAEHLRFLASGLWCTQIFCILTYPRMWKPFSYSAPPPSLAYYCSRSEAWTRDLTHARQAFYH